MSCCVGEVWISGGQSKKFYHVEVAGRCRQKHQVFEKKACRRLSNAQGVGKEGKVYPQKMQDWVQRRWERLGGRKLSEFTYVCERAAGRENRTRGKLV